MQPVIKIAMLATLTAAVSCSGESENPATASCPAAAALTQDTTAMTDENGCTIFGGVPAVQPDGSPSQSGGSAQVPVPAKPQNPDTKQPGDTVIPDPVPPSFAATEGDTIATIRITASAGDLVVDKIDIRKLTGAAAPANCTDGSLLHSATSEFDSIETSDAGWPGEPVSYRACYYNGSTLLAETVAANILPRAYHTMFVSSDSYTGNLKAGVYDHSAAFANGKEGADYRCQHLATVAGRSGTWSALVTSSTSSGPQQAVSHKIYGEIYNNKPTKQKVADNHTALWSSGSLLADVDADEYGNAAGGDVWTGTSDAGGYVYSCANFTSESGSSWGYFGQPVEVDSDWMMKSSVSCSQKRHLYCIDKAPASLTVAAVSGFTTSAGATPGDIDVVIDLPADTSRYGAVKVFALDGNPDTIQPYTCNTPNYWESTVKIYTKDTGDAFPAPADDAFTYAHGASSYYSYRLCAWDMYGNLISETKRSAILTGSDDFNRVFVLRGLDGNLGGVAGADSLCLDAATNAGLTAQWPSWKAIIAATGVNAKNRLTLTGKTYVVGGLQHYAADADEIFGGTGPRAGIWYDATGSFVGSTDAWTGAAADGSPEANNCQDWTSNSNTHEGHVGYADVYGSSNISNSSNTCDSSSLGGLICISSP